MQYIIKTLMWCCNNILFCSCVFWTLNFRIHYSAIWWWILKKKLILKIFFIKNQKIFFSNKQNYLSILMMMIGKKLAFICRKYEPKLSSSFDSLNKKKSLFRSSSEKKTKHEFILNLKIFPGNLKSGILKMKMLSFDREKFFVLIIIILIWTASGSFGRRQKPSSSPMNLTPIILGK